MFRLYMIYFKIERYINNKNKLKIDWEYYYNVQYFMYIEWEKWKIDRYIERVDQYVGLHDSVQQFSKKSYKKI